MFSKTPRYPLLSGLLLLLTSTGCAISDPGPATLGPDPAPLRLLQNDRLIHLYGTRDAARIKGQPYDLTLPDPTFLTGPVKFELSIDWPERGNNVDLYFIEDKFCDKARFLAGQCNITHRTTVSTPVPKLLTVTFQPPPGGGYYTRVIVNFGETDVNVRFQEWVTVLN